MSENEDKGRDVGWAVAQDETRPIREVLRERAQKHNAQSKATREAAFKERARLQGLLLSCLCCWPLIKADTESEHELWCPSHGVWKSGQEVKRIAALRASGEMPQ